MDRLDLQLRPDLIKLVHLLGAEQGDIRLVGGAVRDTLAGLPVKDIDLATRLLPEEVIRRGEAAGLKVIPTGLAHGTVTVPLGSGPVEITTLRSDVATDGRHATISYSDDWREDAARRDFTINALYADPLNGEIFDYFGGRADLSAGVVRFIGEPLKRIAEDHLRILRFFRFQARFGRGAPDKAALDACTARANDLMALSRERIADELLRLLSLQNPGPTVKLMHDRGIFIPVLPEISSEGVIALAALIAAEANASIAPDGTRRLIALLPADPASAEAVGARLKLSKAQRKYMVAVAGRSSNDSADPRALAYWDGPDVALAKLLVDDGDVRAIHNWTPPAFPRTGRAIIQHGISAGPEVARLLKIVERRWVEEGFPGDDRLDAITNEIVGRVNDE